MAAALEWNLNHGQRNARLFEIGRNYRLQGFESVEARALTIGATGEAREKDLYDSAREYSFADLKGDLDAIGALAGNFVWNDGGPDWLHAARRGSIHLNTVNSNEARNLSHLGVAGQLARRVAERLKLRQDVFLAEIEIDAFYDAVRNAKTVRRYEPLPRFPAVERDFSLVFKDSGVTFRQITGAIYHLNIPEIESVQAMDLYRGKNLPPGTFSLMIRVTLQSREGTLTESRIAEISAKLLEPLKYTWGAELRAS